MSLHRKIYEQHYGKIPIDNNGRTYDIHHIDGNNKNNSIDNLIAVPIEEHYNIHLKQENYRAASLIQLRMKMDPKILSELNSLAMKKRVKEGKHVWSGNGDFQRKQQEILKSKGDYYQYSDKHKKFISMRNKKYAEQGIHNFQSDDNKNAVTERNKKSLDDGTHPFLHGVGGDNSRKRVEEGTHHFLDRNAQQNRSERAKLKNSFIIQRIDHQGQIKIYVGLQEAVRDNPKMSRKKIEKIINKNIQVNGFSWKNSGKGIEVLENIRLSNYVVGGIKNDIEADSFKGFSL